jgi:molybdate transport system substrate-binding protein
VFEAQFQAEVVLNFASSSTLAAQINEGAPADVFASADVANMTKVLEEAQAKIFAHNKLVVISSTPEIQSLEDLLTKEYLLVLAAEEVPVGKYARQILKNLEGLYGAGYAEKVLDRLVSNEANVRQAASKVILGEADVAIVYVTDVQGLTDIGILDIPDDYNVLAGYPMAVLPDAVNPVLAQSFVDFVLSKQGQDILSKYGFLSP